jgi:2-C-methyl-D-erythritol 2,4-cyclodiphosphate synthase
MLLNILNFFSSISIFWAMPECGRFIETFLLKLTGFYDLDGNGRVACGGIATWSRNGYDPLLLVLGKHRSIVLRERSLDVRVGIGHDTHRLSEGRPLILGGLRIEHPRGLVGHSDADVVCHAVADALLGAAGLGDIGEHYPDTDPRWRGLDSTRLLSEVVGRIGQAGWHAANCDVIIHAQEPKLGPYKPSIRANLARLLGLEENAVNVKAKTGEHVGTVGRGEVIECEAVVLIELLVAS